LGEDRVPVDADLQADLGVDSGEAAQDVGEETISEILLDPQSDPAIEGATGQGQSRFVIERQQAPGIAQQGVSRLRGNEIAAPFTDQRLARLVLQLVQLGADSGGGAAQPVCSAGEASQIQASDEDPQGIQVVGSLSHGRNSPEKQDEMSKTS
jgi:hypothetical protein